MVAPITALPGRTTIPLKVLLLAAAVVANCALAVLWPDPVFTLIAALLFLLALRQLFAANATALVLMLPFVILHGSVLVSLVAIESGTFMREMGVAGHPSTAGASYLVFSLLFFVLAVATFTRLQRGREPALLADAQQWPGGRPWPVSVAALAIGLAAVGYLALAGIGTGFPLLTGTDRFQFRVNSADTLTLNLLNMKFTLAAVMGAGAVFAASAKQRLAHHATFAAYIGVSFLYGDKFFIILSAASVYAMPFLIRHPARIGRALGSLAPVALLMVASAVAVTLCIYSDYGDLSLASTLARLGGRVAGQGQLWFMAVEDFSTWLRFDTATVSQNLASTVANPAASYFFEHRLGPFFFVEKYAPSAMYFSFLHNGGAVTPTMVFEAYGLATFGYLGLAVLMGTMGAAVGTLLHWLACAMMSGNPVKVLLPAFVTMQTLVFMAQGTVYSVLSLSTFKAYAAFFVLQWLVSVWLNRLAARGRGFPIAPVALLSRG